MTLLNVTLHADRAWLSTDTALVALPADHASRSRPVPATAEEAQRLAFANEPGPPGEIIAYQKKFALLQRERVIVAGSGCMAPLWTLQTMLTQAPLDFDALAWAMETMLAEAATRHPNEREILVVALGWSARERRCAGYSYTTADAFKATPLPVGANVTTPPPSPKDPEYGEFWQLYKAASEGRNVAAYHWAAASNQVRSSRAGLYGGHQAHGGELWLAEVACDGASARSLGDLDELSCQHRGTPALVKSPV